MGMLYRRKQRKATGVLVEGGPWWMKYYDNGRPIFESTRTFERREANAILKKAEHKVLEGHRATSRTRRIKFDDLVTDLKEDYVLRGLRTWNRREFCLARLKPVFGGLLVSG